MSLHDDVDTLVDEKESTQGNEAEAAEMSRRTIRSLVFHLLYAADSHDYTSSLDSIIENFNAGFEANIEKEGEVAQIARNIIDKRDELDEQIKPLLVNWRFDRIGVCTKLVLRFAVWELLYTETNAKIIINEAIELAKCFAEKDAYKFVNGILDEAVKVIRPDEVEELEKQS